MDSGSIIYSTNNKKWRVEFILMNGSLRSILYLATTIAILVLVFKFVSFMLPYVLIAALIIFIYRKIKGTLDYKKEKHEQGSVYTTKPSEEESPFDSEDGEIIDVDYKDVK